MCIQSCIDFTRASLDLTDVKGKAVLEVGAYDVNGTVRAIVDCLEPLSYLGVDIQRGPGVDEICDVHDLVSRYGRGTFDVVITTEMLEHVREWRSAIENLKAVVRPGGALIATTRSPGFKYHGYPADYWRYTKDDMRILFQDFDIQLLEDDPLAPGVFVKARRPLEPPTSAPVLSEHRLYSIIGNRRQIDITDAEERAYLRRTRISRALTSTAQTVGSQVLPGPLKERLKSVLPRRLWQ
jgi:SAM-dependent methyltransferase